MKKTFYFLLTKSIGTYINFLSFVLPEKATQLAHKFFSQPRNGKLTQDRLPKILQDAHSETIQQNEDTIQTYIWKGNETKILLIHGWESNSSRWKRILPQLKKSGSTIIAIDAPAHGLSSGKEFTVIKYAEFIHVIAEKYKPQYIIGHSIGGKTSLYYQYKYQNPTVQKIVILGSPSDFIGIFNNFISMLGLNSKISESLEKKYTDFLNHDIKLFSVQKFVAKINVKGIIVHDIDDTIISFEEGKKIASSWKNAHFIETKGLGHKLHDEDLYQKICAFLFEK